MEIEKFIQQDSEDDVMITETFDLSDSHLPVARDHVRNYQCNMIGDDEASQSYNNIVVMTTDHDTIID